jgi:hypothetical protein
MKRIFLFALFLFLGGMLQAQSRLQHKVDLNALIEETQLSSNDPNAVDIIWWIPPEYWEASFQEDETMSEEEIASIISVLKEYNLLGVVKGKIGLFGGITYEDKDELYENIRFVDHYGDAHKPLTEKELSPDMNNFLGVMRPILANMMGDLGQNFLFFVFDAKNSSDKLIADPFKEHDFTISFGGDASYQFDLPLGALLLPKKCPVDGLEHNGKWNFCPFHGKKLIEQKAQ